MVTGHSMESLKCPLNVIIIRINECKLHDETNICSVEYVQSSSAYKNSINFTGTFERSYSQKGISQHPGYAAYLLYH